MMKKIITLIALLIGSTPLMSSAYMFGLKATHGDPQNIINLENQYNIHIPIVSFIFDPRTENARKRFDTMVDILGPDRIYHLTLSPSTYSAKQVAEGGFDEQYFDFFQKIKKANIKVVFRTMHEMNGGRYSRSSNPYRFKKAWKKVWDYSRSAGLTQENILFDFSVNHRDMPTKGVPSQTAKLIKCTPAIKKKTGCYSFEDYYPGNKYVDIVGFTFYNRGKASSSRSRRTPQTILNMKSRNTLSRLKKFKKPLFIDEVGTTAVFYTGNYSPTKSLEKYQTEKDLKNQRLDQLSTFLRNENRIIGAIYFNIDYTHGLTNPTVGEADWTALHESPEQNYSSIFKLFEESENLYRENSLLDYFNLANIYANDERALVEREKATSLSEMVNIYQYQSGFHQIFEQKASELSGVVITGKNITWGESFSLIKKLFHREK